MKSLHLREFGATIRYHEIAGDKPTIVYLAGLSFPSLPNFLPTVTHPAMPRHHGILIDYLGVGHSERPADFNHSLQNHAKTVAAILDHEGLNNVSIVGYSMGGTVGIFLAMQRPDLVSNLIVCEANITGGGGAATRLFTSVGESTFVSEFFPNLLSKWRIDAREGDQLAHWWVGAWEGVDFCGVHKNSAALVDLDPDLKQEFFSLPIKRTFIYGEASLPMNSGKVTPDAPDPNELRENGISIAIVPDIGHELMIVDPGRFARVLKTAL